ncbi:nucleotide-binding universal stress UspA family protein [Azospirillum agricola]|uniref:universal stress protein n=1 Tax=Azospirillum agricola TaxID=1720247 RepID=UPI002D7ECCCA|nr:universal stress protein [Azospirillum agricola]MBP2230976.1 nucleotide-binding universal stress UspA family protein [Azospirillum agricola]
MTPKDIVVFIEEEDTRISRMAFAAALAERWGAHLIATFVANRIELHPSNGFARGSGVEALLQKHRAAVRDTETRARKAFESLTDRGTVSSEWRLSENEDGEALMLHARHADLAIVGPPARPAGPRRMLSLSEDVIFASGRPTLLLPAGWPSNRVGQRVIVGWNGSREAANAIANAMPFLVAAESVHLVVVPGAQNSLGAEPGADMSRHLARHGVEVVLEQCPGTDAGGILLERARSLDADLLVMGAYGRSKISEFVFGGATRTVLARADVPILLSR